MHAFWATETVLTGISCNDRGRNKKIEKKLKYGKKQEKKHRKEYSFVDKNLPW